MPLIEWLGQSRRDDDTTQLNSGRLINCYRERQGDKFIVKSVLGTEAFASLSGAFMRAMNSVAGVLYAVHGGTLYRINTIGSASAITSIADGPMTTIEGNNGNITVVGGGTYYNVTSGGTVTTPTISEVTAAGSCFFIGQRTVVTEKDGRQFQWSDVADSTTFGGLNFATAESRDDNLIRGINLNNQAVLFGERSIERWYLTGSTDVAEFLKPVSGSTTDIGLKEFGLLTEFPGGVFFVGNDGICYILSGGQIKPVSTRGVETAIKDADAERCFYTEDEGHKFITLVFSDRPAWVYDVSSNEWHERAQGAEYGPWDAVDGAQAYGFNFVGTQLGGVYKLTRNNTDVDGPLFRRGVSATLENEGKRFTIDRFQARPVMGRKEVANAPGERSIVDASDDALLVFEDGDSPRRPEIMFRFSRDGGETWGKPKIRDTGALGEYRKVLSIKALGQFRRATIEFQMSDPVDVPLESTAFLEMS